MPELPEVETTRRGIQASIQNQIINSVTIRNSRLRWPVDLKLSELMHGFEIKSVERRSKYLLLKAENKQQYQRTLIIHLGMSGSIHIVLVSAKQVPQKHDHIDIKFENGIILRYRDPRRFGAVLWCDGNPLEHSLLTNLGPEPLTSDFEVDTFYQASRSKKQTIKQYIMDAKNVVGVGNIYANEALFLSKIRPGRAAGRVSLKEFKRLHKNIIQVLSKAIAKGGTTLKDFVAPNQESNKAEAGYFQQELFVYGRANLPCQICTNTIKQKMISKRNSFYCPNCQH
ncbi:MAG: bifunctional DNA-formamidopyrimidine glycosylase/DNA-(apurinic or apyrimidinic site) lyase [Gammaproteobacteria bacterium]|nr:bifunctional DNA-formamidopyrimidine glycosylase/DNA-(apurinic or apyrimidinic site) lyase [Gammaproteobacteria bacterium]